VLSRFLKYSERYYGVKGELSALLDRRPQPQLTTKQVVAGLFFVACAQLGSLNVIEDALKGQPIPRNWGGWFGGALPSADRLGEVAALLEVEELRGVLTRHYMKRRRGKTLRPFAKGRYILVLDGHEFAASYARSCPHCLERRIKRKGETRVQYYHRYVLAYLVGSNGRILLDMEMQRHGEGEIPAARRLVKRLLAACPRAFQIVSGDALYLDPKLCLELAAAGKDFIAVLKNDNRDLIQDFYGLQEQAPVKTLYLRQRRCLCRDIEGFTSWTQFGRPVRIVQSVETRTVRRQRTKKKETTVSTWMWATTLSRAQMGTQNVVRLGHGRWDIENHGFNELAKYWHADHVYHHDVNAMTAILLLIFLAYNLYHVWYARGLKPQLRGAHSIYFFATLIRSEFFTTLPCANAPP